MSERTNNTPTRHFCRTLPFGAELTGATRANFRLWAPSVSQVLLELEDQTPLPMLPDGGGWFSLETDCQAGDLYKYRLPDGLTVPDPASRFQPDGVHGASEVICPTRYEWRHPDWRGLSWEHTVLYELHVGLCGGYRGVIELLPSLHELGITAVELMPLNQFPGTRNWGYDGVLPFAPDSSYGTPDELKHLVDTAHGLGMMVFLDVVYNHFGPDGNFLHAYAESFFKAGTHTPWGPAIDFDRAEVREFFFENALYWLLEFRFDGLRLDAVHAINNDGWLRELSERVRATVENGRHVHLVLENERNTSSLLVHHFQAQWSDDAHNTMHVLLTGETESYYEAFAEQPLHKLARVLGEGFVYQGEASPIHDGAPRGEPSSSLPSTAFVFFLQNHDQVGNRAFGERLRDLSNDDDLRAATALMLLSPQIPMLFMGEEWGSRQPFFFFTGYTGELADAVREGRRREFAKFAAFNDESRREEIPDPNHPDTFTRSRPAFTPDQIHGDATAWHAFYRNALQIRREYIVPGLHDSAQTQAHSLGVEIIAATNQADGAPGSSERPGGLVAKWKLTDGTTLTITLNLGNETLRMAPLQDRMLFSVPPAAAAAARDGHLSAHSCVVLLSEDPLQSNTPANTYTNTESAATKGSSSLAQTVVNALAEAVGGREDDASDKPNNATEGSASTPAVAPTAEWFARVPASHVSISSVSSTGDAL